MTFQYLHQKMIKKISKYSEFLAKKSTRAFYIFSFLFLISCSASTNPSINTDSQSNTCSNIDEWAQWTELIEKFPNDSDILSLYALRLGLCAMISKKQIDEKLAIQLFDHAHSVVIEKTRQQENQQLKKSTL